MQKVTLLLMVNAIQRNVIMEQMEHWEILTECLYLWWYHLYFPTIMMFHNNVGVKCARSLLNDNESVNVLIGSGYDGPAYESYSPLHYWPNTDPESSVVREHTLSHLHYLTVPILLTTAGVSVCDHHMVSHCPGPVSPSVSGEEFHSNCICY